MQMNPFISFCLYVAARVFVQYLKSKADDSAVQDTLRFLLSAMNALKRRNPLTDSFLVQLDVDLEMLGARIPKLRNAFPRSTESVSHTHHCSYSQTLTYPQPKTPWEQRPGADCHGTTEQDGAGPNGKAGIMAYRNECQFLRGMEDDGNPVNGPDLVAAANGTETTDNSVAGVSRTPTSSTGGGGGGINSQPWHAADQQTSSLPTRERAGGSSPYPQMHGLMPVAGSNAYDMDTASNGLSGTSPDGHSNRPTPNSASSSSAAAADHQRQLGHNNLAAHGPSSSSAAAAVGLRHSSASGGASFETSPMNSSTSSHQLPNNTPQSEMNAASAAAFFADLPSGGGFGMGEVGGTGLTPRFSMSDAAGGNDFAGWEMPGTTGMTPGAEGVLRSIMAMGPMDTMDLGWDTETSMR
jgi:hypothetical protein